ncbi:F0F1 ATP synthase subunit delta [Longibacter salinarum]|uniref:ATP synthase subunit delta n=1 Tax=Longibacter salinarum TaxID=1850348 RepID=A0A2A8CXY3_9BACT|nr:ATP synthase F1 subunit delta [Longibacter salinarum]PEN13555.1 F0F1 ATP synthase subunit delta [Longibacter salinarum]
MSQRTVARRYATALYEEADRLGIVDAIDGDVALLRASLDDSHELHRFFQNPVISDEKKGNVIDALLADRTHELTVRFLKLLVRKDREGMISPMTNQYRALRDEQRGVVEAHVKAAYDLSDDDREALKNALKATTGKKIRLVVDVDESLIGGVVVRIGDRVFDGSVRNKLENLRERFRTGRVGDAPAENGAPPAP